MAMSGQALKATVQATLIAKLKAAFQDDIPPTLDPASRAKIEENWTKLADVISETMIDVVTHIQTQAVVNSLLSSPAVTVASVGGVTTGPGLSGPGAGVLNNPAAVGTIS